MTRTKRTASACMAIAAMAAGALGSASAEAAPSKLTIVSEGQNTVKPNQYFQSNLFFTPGSATVKSGAALTVKDRDKSGEPHTITFVKKSDWPRKFEQFLDCGACNAILGEHAPNGEPPAGEIVPVIDKNAKGVDGPGDSYFFDPRTSVKTTVSAKPGTTLYFLCAIHPWMEGKLKVTK